MPSFNRIDDTMSCASSVGSCSGLGYNGLNLSPNSVTNGCENLEEDYRSDADSNSNVRCQEEGNYVSTSVELGYDLHRSELHAYQKALGALHASGPLTWDEEEKVTNLRRSLNISNDEHLMELRKLRDNEYFMANVGGIHTLLLKP
ncbi:uncharacterized protein LOC120204125 isoform X2 [Hibiscus syriacus]|uniref:uncharacterized protein LOC120204125 isoform X2 n=1 Tax=Hibiscus syriacus TaxID=106335 RepID=UPI00192463A7|nr:uncharacterized protein LOC120204125 isoform X2 [Hibiscus syriacus]XP_039060187.1 uncharacterized protein LOC120204125 isoform X2 [Hibiscus syriacus]XP_039060197.1 uncharacterized protein LOC120204125 isoform X2 [Hibiscus syriacus]